MFSALRFVFVKYAYIWAIALFLLVGAASVTLSLPVAFKTLIDTGITSKDINDSFFVLLLLSLLLAILVSSRFYVMSWIGERVVADIRIAVFRYVVCQPPGYFETLKSGEVLSRLTADTTLIQTLIGSSISIALRSSILLVGGSLMMLITNLSLAVTLISLLSLVIFPVLIFGRKVRKMSRASQDKVADTSAMAGEVLNSMLTVQAFAREKYEIGRYEELVRNAFGIAKKRIFSRAFLTVVAISLAFGGVVATLWLGASQVVDGKLSFGELAEFMLYSVFVAGSLAALAEVWGDLQRAVGATERLIELMDSKSLATESSNKTLGESSILIPGRSVKSVEYFANGSIEFEGVTFAYPSRLDDPTLRDITLSVNSSSNAAIVGLSGVGKTTIFLLLLGFYRPQAGRIFVGGCDIASQSISRLRESIGLVSQEPTIFSTSAMENIRYGKLNATDCEVIEAAKAAYAHNFIEKLPQGYNSFLGERGIRLSTGQRQRIAIARAILKNPPILLLDEATSALDSESESEVQKALEILLPGRTCLIIAHRLSTILKTNKILVLNEGSVSEEGTHTELIKQGGIYKKLASHQFNLKQNV
ncbi:MAG: hypothetical protein CBC42_06955 [Betaproteobacteria bacterium TMED82]|nr:MAG: hypothetical protein CBC42_06955 [Betaproteobacteria bacterium TMED82]